MRSLVLVSVLVLSASTCGRSKATPSPAASAGTVPAASAPKVAKIAKVVFIDKEHACDCTRGRVEGTWAALQAALGTPPSLPVERMHGDTESAKAEAYTTAKPLVALPGVYFIDARGAVVDTLQGEVTTDQISAVLKR
jgi:hypothetical protein